MLAVGCDPPQLRLQGDAKQQEPLLALPSPRKLGPQANPEFQKSRCVYL